MAKAYYIENGSVKPVTGMRVGVNGVARFIKKGWVGVDGVARLCYSQELVAIPTLSGTYTYNGNQQTVTINNLNTNKVNVSGITAAADVGTYQITFSLKSRMDAWADHTQGNKTLVWSIQKKSVTIPTVSGSYTYNGSERSASISGYDSTWMTQTGAAKATNAGTYSVTFTLKSTANCQWADGTVTPKTHSWTISPQIITPPTAQAEKIYYNGDTHSITLSGYNSDTMYKTGTSSAVNAGTYNVQVHLVSEQNYIWSDTRDSEAKTYQWTIKRYYINKPEPEATSFPYDGNGHTLRFFPYFDEATMYKSGTEWAIEMGSYTTYIHLKDTTNHRWWDTHWVHPGDDDIVDINPARYDWAIGKAVGNISVSPNALTFTGSAPERKTCYITGSSNNASDYTAQSSNSKVRISSFGWSTVASSMYIESPSHS